MLAGRTIRFGPFRADLRRRLLIADGRLIPLAPRTWELLELLLARRGEVVTKNELLDALWPGERGSEYAMSRSVRRLREALGDDARQPVYLRTVHGVGYEWFAEVTDSDPLPPVLPVVGRDGELATLQAAFGSVQANGCRVALVEGRAGSGKTTLLDEFVARCRAAGDRVAAARCQANLLSGPASALVDALQPLVGDAAIRAGGVAAAIRELAATGPTALIVDDVAAADVATLDILDDLATAPDDRTRGLLVVLAHRPIDPAALDVPAVPLLARLASIPGTVRIVLGGLGPDAVDALVTARLGGPLRDRGAAEQLRQWTSGNPLHLRIVLDHLVASGAIAPNDDAEWVVIGPPLDELAVPVTLPLLLDERIARLPRHARRLLEVLALAGRCDRQTLADLADLDPAEADAALAPLVGELLAVDGLDVELGHAAIRAAIVPAISRTRAIGWHRRIADALSRRDDARHRNAEIADHYLRGGQPDRAIPLLLALGQSCRRQSAHHDALAAFDLAVEAHAALGVGAASDAERLTSELQARIGLALSQLFLRSRQNDDTAENVDAINRLAEQLPVSPATFNLWQAVLLVDNMAGRIDGLRAIAPRLVEIAAVDANPARSMDAIHAVGEVALHDGRPQDALAAFDRAAELRDAAAVAIGTPTRGQQMWLNDSGGRIHAARAGAALLAGRLDLVVPATELVSAVAADGAITPLVELADEAIAAATLLLAGERDRARQHALRCEALLEREHHDFRAVADTVLWSTGTPWTRAEARATARVLLDRPTIPYPLGLMVFLGTDLLPPDEMLDLVELAIEETAAANTHWADAELLRIRGALVRVTGPSDADALAEATSCFDRALSIAVSQRADFLADRVRASIAAC